ncbi:hypothetical protein [Mesorhizobium sp. ESP-6-2]|uniref:hypothetical protein n=1 Tax=Mesorhizobium sp. ESP-6-2 TaxID=2876625 RepID=UPI001CCD25F7|nr:hypothetical protein [Mesorhizobium sp. ESP-6-2]MBZ9807670.1 hypothetical protein [Mesorhizobium sp. ESP-6-2]
MNAHTSLTKIQVEDSDEPETPVSHPILMLVLLIAAGWAATGGALYSAYRAIEALAGWE